MHDRLCNLSPALQQEYYVLHSPCHDHVRRQPAQLVIAWYETLKDVRWIISLYYSTIASLINLLYTHNFSEVFNYMEILYDFQMQTHLQGIPTAAVKNHRYQLF